MSKRDLEFRRNAATPRRWKWGPERRAALAEVEEQFRQTGGKFLAVAGWAMPGQTLESLFERGVLTKFVFVGGARYAPTNPALWPASERCDARYEETT